MNINGVEAVGQGKQNDKDCILVFYSILTREIKELIPPELQGFPIRLIESGIIRAEKLCQKKSTPENVKGK